MVANPSKEKGRAKLHRQYLSPQFHIQPLASLHPPTRKTRTPRRYDSTREFPYTWKDHRIQMHKFKLGNSSPTPDDRDKSKPSDKSKLLKLIWMSWCGALSPPVRGTCRKYSKSSLSSKLEAGARACCASLHFCAAPSHSLVTCPLLIPAVAYPPLYCRFSEGFKTRSTSTNHVDDTQFTSAGTLAKTNRLLS